MFLIHIKSSFDISRKNFFLFQIMEESQKIPLQLSIQMIYYGNKRVYI